MPVDIIDKNVRISDTIMEGLLSIYRRRICRVLKPKRQKRDVGGIPHAEVVDSTSGSL